MDVRSKAKGRVSKYRRATRAALLLVGSIAIAAVGFWLCLPLVPLPERLFQKVKPEWEFVDRKGEPLRAVRPDGSPFAQNATYAEIPQRLIDATLAAEDRRFWEHPGVDWRGTARAAWQLVTHRRVVSGGSTITQQLIKLAEPRPRTLRTKLIEMVQALRLEQRWNKQQILSEYLNRLDYGNLNRGCAAAAAFYFGKPLQDLSPAECALLAGLPQAPTRLNPRAHFDRAIKRQRWILGQMRDDGWLTAEQFERSCREPVQLARNPRTFEAPHFIDLIAAQTGEGFGPNPIRTTLDLELNRFAESTLHQHLSTLKAQHVSNGAVVILDNRSGDVLAMVGSDDYFAASGGQVNGAWAARSAGSTFKPFTYLLALEHGATPATVVADVPTEFSGAAGLFAPANYNRHCYGPVRYRTALANSLNIPAVKVLASLGGPEPLWRLLRECGLTTLNRPAAEYGLGLTIGNAEARLLELANAYACLARLGKYRSYRILLSGPGGMEISQSRNQRADEIPTPKPQAPRKHQTSNLELQAEQMPGSSGWQVSNKLRDKQRIADADAAYLIADILHDNDARLMAFGAESPLRFEFPVACKTGTSSDFRDNWALGFTPEFTVGVWVGNADGSPMEGVSGVTGAAPVLHEVFEYLHEHEGTTWYPTPTNIVDGWVNPLTGKRRAENAMAKDYIQEKFVASHLPSLERESDYLTNGPTRLVRLGSEYGEWFDSADNWLAGRVGIERKPEEIRIEFPLPGTTVYLDSDLPENGGRVGLNAVGPEPVEWRSDTLSVTNAGGRWSAWLSEGRHHFTVWARHTGARAETWINVIER